MEELVAEFEHLKIIRCIGMIDLHGTRTRSMALFNNKIDDALL